MIICYFDLFANHVQHYKRKHKHDLLLMYLHYSQSRLQLLIHSTRNRIDEMSCLQNFIYSIYTRCEDLNHLIF